MVRAMGFSNGTFDPHRPGRLCRGRERWIEPWELDDDTSVPKVSRLILSGAAFSDISAADALRGLPHAGVEAATLINTLFPRKNFFAFMEDGHPADIPEEALGVELYDGYVAGGREVNSLVRWHLRLNGVKALRQLFAAPPPNSEIPPVEDRLRGLVVLDNDDATHDEALFNELFALVGFSTRDSPPARFQPAALPDLVQKVKALILIHRDKHGLALGIYTREPIDMSEKLEGLCKKAECLLVPFAIPPMLARWDRALMELRDDWEGDDADFPVPEPEGGYTWENRRRRRRDRRKGGGSDEDEDS